MTDEERIRRMMAKDEAWQRKMRERRAVMEAELIVARERLDIAKVKFQRAMDEAWLQMYGPRP